MTGIRTLAIIKPDATQHAPAITRRIREEGFIVRAAAKVRLSRGEAGLLYAEHLERPFYGPLVEFMSSAPVHVLALERADAVDHWRRVLGATNPLFAEPDTLREQYGDKSGIVHRNACHGSDSDAAADREIGYFFDACRSGDSQLRLGVQVAELQASTHDMLDAEVFRSKVKFPRPRFKLAALVEEVGELANALASGNRDAIHREALQVACVACRIAEDGDETEYRPDGFIEIVYAVGGVARYLMQRKTQNVRELTLTLLASARRLLVNGDATFNDVDDEVAQP